jgi:hypothetical protein
VVHLKLPRLPKLRSPFDGDDLRLAASGIILACIITLAVLWGALLAGEAVRLFLIAAGLR